MLSAERLREAFGNDTQAMIAEKVCATQSSISKWLSGDGAPGIDSLCEISKAYKVSVDWLLGLSDQKEIVDVSKDNLTYELLGRIIDDLLSSGTLIIPDLNTVIPGSAASTGEEASDDEEPLMSPPRYDSDYLKVRDRVLSFMLRRRMKLYEMGKDFEGTWRERSLSNYKGIRILDFNGNMEEAVDTHSWSTYNTDADWISLIKELSSMSEEQRAAIIEKSRERDRRRNG